MIATKAAAMINGALRFTREDIQTVVQIEIAASEFGGTVISCACQLWNPRPAMMVGYYATDGQCTQSV